jgi:ribosome-associated protein
MTNPPNRPNANPKPRAGASASDQKGILDREAARNFARQAARSLLDDRCEDVIILDVADLTTVTACIVIGSGTSDRQMQSALKNLNTTAKQFGTRALHISADDNSTWLLADFVDVVVHLFEPNARAHYDLDMLWNEAPRLEPAPQAPRPSQSPSQPGPDA